MKTGVESEMIGTEREMAATAGTDEPMRASRGMRLLHLVRPDRRETWTEEACACQIKDGTKLPEEEVDRSEAMVSEEAGMKRPVGDATVHQVCR